MNEKLELALRSMGYRQLEKKHLWAKPVGLQVFRVDTNELKISSLFKGADGQVHCWSGNDINKEDDLILNNIALFESYNARDFPSSRPFNFLTPEEQTQFTLNKIGL